MLRRTMLGGWLARSAVDVVYEEEDLILRTLSEFERLRRGACAANCAQGHNAPFRVHSHRLVSSILPHERHGFEF